MSPARAGPDGGETTPALTSGHVHGVKAGQQVTAPLAVAFHLAKPVVAVEVVTEVRPLHVGHDHPVQVPAGVQACVVVFDPGAETDTRIITGRQETMPFPCRNFQTFPPKRGSIVLLLLLYLSNPSFLVCEMGISYQ